MNGARLAPCVLLAALVGCKAGEGDAAPRMIAHDSWCPDGFEQSTAEACFALPAGETKDAPILLYLHGMFKDHEAKEEWAAVHAATKRGFAVVIPRGKRGACAWKADVKDFFCWPQEPEDTAEMKATVAEWDKVLWQVDALLDPGKHRRYVLAFSNGGFFAEHLATHGLFDAQAWAIVNGGALVPPGTKTKATPMLLVAAEDDKDQAPRMKELHDTLTKVGWPHAYCPRPGPHGLTPEDVDQSLRFFRRDATDAKAAPSCK